MDDMHGIEITSRDRALRAWENAMELVRDYQEYARHTEKDQRLSALFRQYAEDEAEHASALREILLEMERERLIAAACPPGS